MGVGVDVRTVPDCADPVARDWAEPDGADELPDGAEDGPLAAPCWRAVPGVEHPLTARTLTASTAPTSARVRRRGRPRTVGIRPR